MSTVQFRPPAPFPSITYIDFNLNQKRFCVRLRVGLAARALVYCNGVTFGPANAVQIDLGGLPVLMAKDSLNCPDRNEISVDREPVYRTV